MCLSNRSFFNRTASIEVGKEDEERQREQRNERQMVDCYNEFKQIEQRGPLMDRTPSRVEKKSEKYVR